MSGYSILDKRKKIMILNPDFHVTVYLSEEVIRMGCLTVGFMVAVWGIVKMTDILFGKRKCQQPES